MNASRQLLTRDAQVSELAREYFAQVSELAREYFAQVSELARECSAQVSELARVENIRRQVESDLNQATSQLLRNLSTLACLLRRISMAR